jgi:hypothetical protein
MAGIKRPDLPPETPFLQSDGHNLVNRTPILRRFAVNKTNGTSANPNQALK